MPTVDIGQRQQGRLAAKSVLHCAASADAITATIRQALAPLSASLFSNPYGDGQTSQKILSVLREAPLSAVKTFYDIPRSGAQ